MSESGRGPGFGLELGRAAQDVRIGGGGLPGSESKASHLGGTETAGDPARQGGGSGMSEPQLPRRSLQRVTRSVFEEVKELWFLLKRLSNGEIFFRELIEGSCRRD